MIGRSAKKNILGAKKNPTPLDIKWSALTNEETIHLNCIKINSISMQNASLSHISARLVSHNENSYNYNYALYIVICTTVYK